MKLSVRHILDTAAMQDVHLSPDGIVNGSYLADSVTRCGKRVTQDSAEAYGTGIGLYGSQGAFHPFTSRRRQFVTTRGEE